jgi:diguanylate cyclase (GGDEF)-like protein
MNTRHYEKTLILDSMNESIKRELSIPYIVVLAGEQVGRVVRLHRGNEYIMGRQRSCNIFLDDANISRKHAMLKISSQGIAQLSDFGSTNGTRVNGKKIKEQQLFDGDRISIGNFVLKFAFKDDVEFLFQNKLYEKATKDTLTGIYNRAFFLDVMQREYHFHKRTKKPLSLLFFDIDNFKLINDTYGHLSGDMVLKIFTKEILGGLRQEDIFARYGGEEFVALFSDTQLNDAVQIAEKLRTITESIDFETEETVFKTSVTIGVVTFQNGNYKSIDAFLQAADELLYLGKGQGKNRVVFSKEMSTP